MTRGLYESCPTSQLFERALDGAMSLIGGDFGNLELMLWFAEHVAAALDRRTNPPATLLTERLRAAVSSAGRC